MASGRLRTLHQTANATTSRKCMAARLTPPGRLNRWPFDETKSGGFDRTIAWFGPPVTPPEKLQKEKPCCTRTV